MQIPAVARPTLDMPTVPIVPARRPFRYMPLIPVLPRDRVELGASTDNPWKLPIRTGKIELSALWTRKRGEITKSDREGFIMVVEDQSIKVLADPARGDGHVSATLNGETQHGVITNSGKSSTLRLDDGTTITVTDKGRERFSVSGIAPVTVDVRYIDGIRRRRWPVPDSHAEPWHRGRDPRTMTFPEKVREYIRSLFEVSGE